MSRITDYILEPKVVYTEGGFLVRVKVIDDYKYKKYIVSENLHYKTVQGTSFTITDADTTKQAEITEMLGNTIQEGTPTPTSPVEVQTVSGDNNIVVGNNILILNMQEYAKQNSEYFSFSYENGLTALKKDNRAMANVGYLMEVQPNTTYYVKTETDKRLLIAQYSTSTAWVRNDEVYNGGNFTTNSNVHYLRCKVADTLTTFPTVVGKTYISLSSNYQGNTYRVDLGGKNKFNKSTVTNGYYLNERGGLTSNNNYCVSAFIPIDSGEPYYIPTRGTSRTKFYTSNKTAYSNTWDVTDGSKSFTVPSGVSFIRISIAIAGGTAVSLDTFQFEKRHTSNTIQPIYRQPYRTM